MNKNTWLSGLKYHGLATRLCIRMTERGQAAQCSKVGEMFTTVGDRDWNCYHSV